MAGQLYGSTIGVPTPVSVGEWLTSYEDPILQVVGYVEIWSSINAGYGAQTLLGTFSYVSGTVKIDRSNIIRRTATDIVLLNDAVNDPGNDLLPIAGTDDGWFSPYGNEMWIFKGAIVGGAPPSWAGSAFPDVPITITAGGNDVFYLDSPSLELGEIAFVVAPGTYTTADEFGDALNAATYSNLGSSPIPFSAFATFSTSFFVGECAWNTDGPAANDANIGDSGYGAGPITSWMNDGSSFNINLEGGANGVAAYAQEGVFLIEEVDIINDDTGLTFKGTMNDRMEWLSRLSYNYAWSIDPTVTPTINDAIDYIIGNAANGWWGIFSPFPLGIWTTISATPPISHYAIGDDPSKLATDIASAYGCALYFDAMGALNLVPVPDPSTISPCVQYLEGTSSGSVAITRALSNAQVPNVICVETGGTKANPSATVWWWDSYPGSPTYYASAPGDWTMPQTILPANAGSYPVLIQKYTTNIQQGNPTAAQAMALAIGLTSIGSLESTTFSIRDQPAHDIDDVITCLRVIAGIPADTANSLPGFNYVLDEVDIDLAVDGQGTQCIGRLVWSP